MNRGRAGDMAGKHRALVTGIEVTSHHAARSAHERPTIRRDIRDEVTADIARDGKDRDRTAGVDVLRRDDRPASVRCGFNPDLRCGGSVYNDTDLRPVDPALSGGDGLRSHGLEGRAVSMH